MKKKKLIIIQLILTILFIIPTKLIAQENSNVRMKDSISISKFDFEKMFKCKIGDIFLSETTELINESVVLINNEIGENKQLKLKLKNNSNVFLIIQVNGKDSIQLFVISDNKLIFYKNNHFKNSLTLVKCEEDDIISE